MSYEVNNASQEKEDQMCSVETVSEMDDEQFKKIFNLLSSALPENFPENARYEKDELINFVEDKKNIALILKQGKEIAGTALLQPYNEAVKELREFDPMMIPDDENKYYGAAIVISPEYRKKEWSTLLNQKLIEELEKRKVEKFAVHIRSERGRHDNKIGYLFGEVKYFRTIENWLGTGEPFDYLEFEIKK